MQNPEKWDRLTEAFGRAARESLVAVRLRTDRVVLRPGYETDPMADDSKRRWTAHEAGSLSVPPSGR